MLRRITDGGDTQWGMFWSRNSGSIGHSAVMGLEQVSVFPGGPASSLADCLVEGGVWTDWSVSLHLCCPTSLPAFSAKGKIRMFPAHTVECGGSRQPPLVSLISSKGPGHHRTMFLHGVHEPLKSLRLTRSLSPG